MTTSLLHSDIKLIRINDLANMIGYHQSSINHMVSEGRFPQRLKIGPSASGWLLPEIKSWINQNWKLGDSFSPPLLDEPRLLRMKDVLDLLGVKRDTLYRLIKRNEFPEGKKLSHRERRWEYNDIMGWLAGKIQERDERQD
ncbi:helix-turn-helix transcriptional regulator [Vibrio chagasii]|uniref:helix-turn-helix transcriptional regulator n=1 Tax=Vibrio chagasii TaxID=170679 RepID=UPI002284430E|nr:AlpA family phage regulatory protein [Vibrio chagasii]MCY9829499.1 AlpA family phage regulatory protein [Vibrio chagasii]